MKLSMKNYTPKDTGFQSYPKIFFVTTFVLILLFVSGWSTVEAEVQPDFDRDEIIEVGVARIDITPEGPIRLAGYGGRDSESDGVIQRLEAKALAFGTDNEGISLFITVDLIGIQGHMTKQLRDQLSEKVDLDPAQLVISSSHTHTGPEIGNLLNHFGEPLPSDELGHIAEYLEQLSRKLEKVSLEALENRSPSLVSWGQGNVDFAMNRRVIENGKWTGFGVVPDGPVDHSMPLMRVTDTEGNIRALLVNYACHGTTLGPDINEIHGDWMGEAQRILEERHPGAVAMISIGAGGDANPEPRTKMEHTTQHGKAIADEVDRLLAGSLQPITSAPIGRYKEIELPYANVPTVDELIEQTNASGARGYYAHLALDRLARGETIPASLTYPIQTWTFGNDLTMVLLAGEVVVDYSHRLKEELNDKNLWVTAYVNDVPCYIASKRLIREGGYEVDSSMYSYNHPSRFDESIEDLIVETVHELVQ